MAEDALYGYEKTDEIEQGGKYLSFRKGDKGKVITIRLTSAPKYINQHWILGGDGKTTPVLCKGEDCPYCGKDVPANDKIDKVAKWGWIVIDRADGNVKIFTGPTLIARKIRKLVENPKWGNPLLYDVEIIRDEEPGAGYYNVTPVPDGKGDEITAEEKKKVTDSGYDLSKELVGAKESKHTGNYENVPEEGKVEVPDDLGEPAKVEVEAEDPADEIPF